MSVTLVSSNDHPTPHGHEAEWLQHLLEHEQAEADGLAAYYAEADHWAALYAIGFACFGAGIAVCLVSEIVILLIVKGVPWS